MAIKWNRFIPVLFFILAPATALGQEGPKVMAASNWKPGMAVSGWWMSEKLDGVRGCWNGEKLISKSGKPLGAPPGFTKGFPDFPLDGELWMGRKKFSQLMAIVQSKNPGNQWEKIGYHIFDVPRENLGFEQRMDLAREWFSRHPLPHVHIIPQIRCKDGAHLQQRLKFVENLGGEGLMLRRPGSLYQTGRSRDILKVKTFHDAEAVVTGHRPGKGRHQGRMGALEVVLPNGITFAIGTGFTDAQRENPPPIGTTITFKYKEINPSGIPRFASFLRVKKFF